MMLICWGSHSVFHHPDCFPFQCLNQLCSSLFCTFFLFLPFSASVLKVMATLFSDPIHLIISLCPSLNSIQSCNILLRWGQQGGTLYFRWQWTMGFFNSIMRVSTFCSILLHFSQASHYFNKQCNTLSSHFFLFH